MAERREIYTMKTIEKMKNKVKAIPASVKGAAVAAAGTVTSVVASCANDANTQLQQIMKFIFNAMIFGGVVFLALGAINIVKAVASQDGGGDPHQLAKGIGQVIGGIVMIGAKWIVTQIMGQDPTSFQFFQ